MELLIRVALFVLIRAHSRQFVLIRVTSFVHIRSPFALIRVKKNGTTLLAKGPRYSESRLS